MAMIEKSGPQRQFSQQPQPTPLQPTQLSSPQQVPGVLSGSAVPGCGLPIGSCVNDDPGEPTLGASVSEFQLLEVAESCTSGDIAA
jgi:hypothetical protein